MKKIVRLFLVLISSYVFSQEVQLNDAPFSLNIVKHRILPKIQTKELIRLGKGNKMFFVRVKLESNGKENELFDVNLFSLIVDKYKIRIRPMEADYVNFSFSPISKVFKENHRYVQIYAGNIYDPSIPDTFYDFPYKDYKNIVACVNYGSKKEPLIWEYYYSSREIKSNMLNLVFIVSSDVYNGSLFYGNQKISDFTFDK